MRAAHDNRHASTDSRRAWHAGTSKPVTATAPAGHASTHGASQAAQPSPGAGAGGSSPIDDHQRPVRPPRPEDGVNLQAERSRTAEPRGAPEPLERNQRRRSGERKIRRVCHRERRQGAGDRCNHDARGEAIERVCRAVVCLGRLAREAIEERRAA